MQNGEPRAARYVTVWEFQVRPGSEQAFERSYGSDGEWVQLFRKARGYVRTDLYRDLKDRQRYVTIDLWESEAAYLNFREQYVREYGAIDQRCQEMTAKETALGAYEIVQAIRLDRDTGTDT